MGLLDVLNGMQQGPRGPSDASAQSGGGMSPMTMAILALLAYKAVKHLGGGQAGATPAPAPGKPRIPPRPVAQRVSVADWRADLGIS
jgi:hypothetical protein